MLDITKDIQSLTTFRRRSGDFMKQLKKSNGDFSVEVVATHGDFYLGDRHQTPDGDPARFAAAGIAVEFADYAGYPAPRLSVIDGVLNS